MAVLQDMQQTGGPALAAESGGEHDKPGDAEQDDPKSLSSAKAWRARIDRCKRVRKDLISAWADNVDYRRGKPFDQESDETRVNVSLDWSLTKGKHAQLFSQMPQVYLTSKQPAFEQAVPVFGKKLNETLDEAHLGNAITECVMDCINASGVGIVLCGYQATTRMTQVVVSPPNFAQMAPQEQQMLQATGGVKMEDVPEVINARYFDKRISPADFLWPIEFTGSNFDDGDWIGHSDRMLWPEAQRELKLTDDQRQEIESSQQRSGNLRREYTQSQYGSDDLVVEYDELFYWASRYDADEKYFSKIRRIVFVKGLTKPVISEDYKGQELDEASNQYIGVRKFPLRVLTLTYISDDAIPPSDSSVGRPQIDELIRSRSQMILQRARSQPIRWFDVNRIDLMIQDALMRGTYEGFIPTKGDGTRAIGEVARASYPSEDWTFDATIKQDLNEQWQVGSNQQGQMSKGRRSSAEAQIVQQNFQTRIGYERAQVAAFITGIAEVMGGLLAKFGTFALPALSPEDQQRLGTWDRKHIGGEFVYWIRPDSTILMDANQRIERLMKVLNLVGKSPYVNPKPLITEIIELHGVDPAGIMIDPPPPKPDPLNISIRFSGVQDLTNPMTIALLAKHQQLPSPEELEAAKKVLAALGAPSQPVEAQPPGSPEAPETPHPDWGGMPKIVKRASDI